jgi:hypothetical protein
MIIDAFQLLTESGFIIRKYKYVGMGSIHFIDFSMFHKYFGISDMLSVEASEDIDNRIIFNTPYKNVVQTKTGEFIGDAIADLDSERSHFLWLDYDDVICDFMIRDLIYAITTLRSSSILLFTVDTEPPKRNAGTDSYETRQQTQEYYYSVASKYLASDMQTDDFSYDNLHHINIRVIANAIQSSMNSTDRKFHPIFNFIYKDGHRMLTIGGMVVDSTDEEKLKNSPVFDANYARKSFDDQPFYINVPKLTRREQILLDSFMPCEDGWKPDEFEISIDDVKAYKDIYRFFPSYAELFI